MRQDPVPVLDELRAVPADALVDRDVLGVHRNGLGDEAALDRVEGLASERRVFRLHALDRPEEIARGRPGPAEPVADRRESFVRAGRAPDAQESEGDPVRRGDADGRGAPDDHRLDGDRDFLVRPADNIGLLERELPLVDHDDRVVAPFDCGEHFNLDRTKYPLHYNTPPNGGRYRGTTHSEHSIQAR